MYVWRDESFRSVITTSRLLAYAANNSMYISRVSTSQDFHTPPSGANSRARERP